MSTGTIFRLLLLSLLSWITVRGLVISARGMSPQQLLRIPFRTTRHGTGKNSHLSQRSQLPRTTWIRLHSYNDNSSPSEDEDEFFERFKTSLNDEIQVMDSDLEDDIDFLMVSRAFQTELKQLNSTNKLLYGWLKDFMNENAILKQEGIKSWSHLLSKLQSTPPSVVSAVIKATSNSNATASLRFNIKPYVIIPSLLKTKSAQLNTMLASIESTYEQIIQLIFDLDDEKSDFEGIKAWYECTREENPMALARSPSVYNQLELKFIVRLVESYFRNSETTTETKFVSDIFKSFHQWGDRSLSFPSDYLDLSAQGLWSNGIASSSLYSLSPVELFYTFYETSKKTLFADSSRNIHSLSEFSRGDQYTLLLTYLVTVGRVLSLLKSTIQGMQETHLDDVTYFDRLVKSLKLTGSPILMINPSNAVRASVRNALQSGSVNVTDKNDSLELSTSSSSSSSVSQDDLVTVRIFNTSLTTPHVEVSIQDTKLSDDEKESFLQLYVLKLLNSTSEGEGGDERGNSTDISATAGNPNPTALGDGTSTDSSGDSSIGSDCGRQGVLLSPVSEEPQTQAGASAVKIKPRVALLDPPRDRPPPPSEDSEAERRVYEDDGENPTVRRSDDEINFTDSLNVFYSHLGDNCQMRILGEKEEDGVSYYCVQGRASNTGAGTARRQTLTLWVRSEDVKRQLSGGVTSSSDRIEASSKSITTDNVQVSPTDTSVSSVTNVDSVTATDFEDDGMLILPTQHFMDDTGSLLSPAGNTGNTEEGEEDRNWVCDNPFDIPKH